jgi:hypothetical protein
MNISAIVCDQEATKWQSLKQGKTQKCIFTGKYTSDFYQNNPDQ